MVNNSNVSTIDGYVSLSDDGPLFETLEFLTTSYSSYQLPDFLTNCTGDIMKEIFSHFPNLYHHLVFLVRLLDVLRLKIQHFLH